MITDLLKLLLLAALHLVTGMGILRLLRIQLRYGMLLPLAAIIGVGIAAWVPFLLQLCYVPIDVNTVFGTLGVLAILSVVYLIYTRGKVVQAPFSFHLSLYELPAIALLAIILGISIWRCYYLPVIPRDMLSGPETIANYAVREHTFINSFFDVDFAGINNNPFKPMSVTSLQVIYKLAGFPFGSMWLSILVVSFILFLYQLLSQRLHPVLAGVLLLLFLSVGEMYGYTFMVLYDYSNAIYFALGIYFLTTYMQTGRRRQFALAVLLLSSSVYFRLETLVLAFMLLPLLLVHWRKQRTSLAQQLLLASSFGLVLFLSYYLPGSVYNNSYLPVHYSAGSQINSHLSNLNPLIQRFKDINGTLLFSAHGLEEYGWLLYLFLGLLIAELIKNFGITRDGRNWLYAILVVYFGLSLLGYLLPLMDLANSTKRGLFKLFPLLLLYLSSNAILIQFSGWLRNWEQKKFIQAEGTAAV